MHTKLLKHLFTVSLLTLHSLTSWAHSPADSEINDLKSLVAKSDAVIYGTVVDVAYRNSEPTDESPQGLPHTFVTYQIAEVLRGTTETTTLTLKVPGGADGLGGIYNVSDAPQFANGQTDILFVSEENIDDCPLVNCVDGRFRVFEQHVYNGWGVPLASSKKELVFGGKPRFDLNVMDLPRPTFEAVMQQPNVQDYLRQNGITSKQQLAELKAKYQAESPATYQVKLNVENHFVNDDDLSKSPGKPMVQHGKPVFVDTLLAQIREVNGRIKGPRTAVRSANAKKRFLAKTRRQQALTALPDVAQKISQEELEDRRKRHN